jgi:hypothetical protein
LSRLPGNINHSGFLRKEKPVAVAVRLDIWQTLT